MYQILSSCSTDAYRFMQQMRQKLLALYAYFLSPQQQRLDLASQIIHVTAMNKT